MSMQLDLGIPTDRFAESRTVITGGPQTGKTTMAASAPGSVPIFATDDLIGEFEWSELSLEVSKRFDRPSPWLIEGVAAVRAVRKWMVNNEGGTPCDLFVYLEQPVAERTPGQVAMAKGVATIFAGIRDDLLERGVCILTTPEALRPVNELWA